MYTPETGGRVVAIHALRCSSHAEEAVPVPSCTLSSANSHTQDMGHGKDLRTEEMPAG
jgi:hypothetical protein